VAKIIKTFGDFVVNNLTENNEATDTLVLTYGRFNPPTTGHELLIRKVREIAEHRHALSTIFVSRSVDKTKNPLSVEDRIHYIHKMFPSQSVMPAHEVQGTSGLLGVLKYIYKEGHLGKKINNVYIVVGSDRVPEFTKKLNQYNGKTYNFDKIEVVSAGERDPDDEASAAGMSGTKMRAAAMSMDFEKFRHGISKTISDQEAKEMMQKIRKNLSVKESFDDINKKIMIKEGVHDKPLFKCVFLIGGTGSGKDFVLSKVLLGHGFIESNPDIALEYFMDREKLSKSMPEDEAEKRYVIRSKAINLTKKKREYAINGRLGLIINGTGDNYQRYEELKKDLESLGYECKAIFVTTSNEVSKKRNIERGQLGGRMVPENVRAVKWQETMKNKDKIKSLFGDKDFIEFDNSADLRNANAQIRKQKGDELLRIFKEMRKFAEKPPSSPIAHQWIEHNRNRKSVSKTNEAFDSSFNHLDNVFESLFHAGSSSEPVIHKIDKTVKKIKKKGAALVPVIMMKKKKKHIIKDR